MMHAPTAQREILQVTVRLLPGWPTAAASMAAPGGPAGPRVGRASCGSLPRRPDTEVGYTYLPFIRLWRRANHRYHRNYGYRRKHRIVKIKEITKIAEIMEITEIIKLLKIIEIT